jgi:hypothetical protein
VRGGFVKSKAVKGDLQTLVELRNGIVHAAEEPAVLPQQEQHRACGAVGAPVLLEIPDDEVAFLNQISQEQYRQQLFHSGIVSVAAIRPCWHSATAGYLLGEHMGKTERSGRVLPPRGSIA